MFGENRELPVGERRMIPLVMNTSLSRTLKGAFFCMIRVGRDGLVHVRALSD